MRYYTGFVYTKDDFFKEVLYDSFYKMAMEAFRSSKDKRFLHQLIVGCCIFIENKKFMGMRLRPDLRNIVHKIIDCRFKQLLHRAEEVLKKKNNLQKVGTKLNIAAFNNEGDFKKQAKALLGELTNSVQLCTDVKDLNYLTNTQMLVLGFNSYACAIMPKTFSDLIKVCLLKLYLSIILNSVNVGSLDLPFLKNKYLIDSMSPQKNRKRYGRENSHDEVNKFAGEVSGYLSKIGTRVTDAQRPLVKEIYRYLLSHKQQWLI